MLADRLVELQAVLQVAKGKVDNFAVDILVEDMFDEDMRYKVLCFDTFIIFLLIASSKHQAITTTTSVFGYV